MHGFEGAHYKGFPNRALAEAAYNGELEGYSNEENEEHPNWESWSVDAACEGNPGIMEFQCVDTSTGRLIFHEGPFDNGTNNIGEFLAIVHALKNQVENELSIPIYSDSRTAMAWLRKKKVGSKLPREAKTQQLWQMLDDAVSWLKLNEVHVPVKKWQTESWGEIPADFGRK